MAGSGHWALLRWRTRSSSGRHADGNVVVVRYADDTVVGFELRSDVERFVDELRQRLQNFGLELHPHKTRIIEFGRFAARNRKAQGRGKPETFAFLGFTHIGGTTATPDLYETLYRGSALGRSSQNGALSR